MMNHDPFQSYQTTGAYSGGVTPYGLPFTALQPFLNPAAFAGYGVNQQHLQGGFGGGQNPILQNPILQNPALQNPALQNPLLQQAILQNQLQQLAWQQQLLGQGLGNQGWPQQQQQYTGYPLAPQGLIGGGIGQQGGFGQAGAYGQPGVYGQIHPLAQMALRQASGYGISPFGGGF
jgi:hypothetical protein